MLQTFVDREVIAEFVNIYILDIYIIKLWDLKTVNKFNVDIEK